MRLYGTEKSLVSVHSSFIPKSASAVNDHKIYDIPCKTIHRVFFVVIIRNVKAISEPRTSDASARYYTKPASVRSENPDSRS